MSDFVHLHVHTHYSFLDSSVQISPLIQQLGELGMTSVAMTDHDVMCGAVEFFKSAKAAGIKPILGYEPTIAHHDATDPEDRSRYQIVLLAKNDKGYRNLCKLNHIAHSEGGKTGFPRISPSHLAEHNEGLILLTGNLAGDIPQLLMLGRDDEARERLRFYRDVLGPENVFIELQDHGIAEEHEVLKKLVALAEQESCPLVATNDVHYLEEDDRKAHEVLMAIQLGRCVDWDINPEHRPRGFHLASEEEMVEKFREFPEAIANTKRIADMCDVEISMGTYYLPQYDCPPGKSLGDVMIDMAEAGLKTRFEELREQGYQPDEEEYRKRLTYENGIIIQMDFPGYFLIVADYVQWARDQGIPVGPGRGSGAGSLVAYALRITDIDPMLYGLLFERFLNPERVSMPDFDVDFCQSRRGEVIDYAIEKYGADNVGQIITYGTMKAKAVVRDVARALGMSPQEGDKIAKLIPPDLGITLETAYDQESRIPALMEEDPRYAQLYECALKLEGLNRQAGIHASAVVISDEPLWHYMPTSRGANDELITQYAMTETEEVGLVKFDFLGLKTLTVLDHAERLVQRHSDPEFSLTNLPITDAATYKLITSGNTLGVFQLESTGFQELLRKLKPDCFEDIVAAVALYRPGPLGSGMVDDFVKRKHGETLVAYPHPWLEGILKETYGVIVYQEQVMQIASILGGFSLGQADLLRRAMGKKKEKEMIRMREIFLEGTEKNSVNKETAEHIFDLMAYFAGYGFNKSHSAAYAMLTYHTGYLKAHYPAAFFAAMLTSDSNKTDKVVRYVFEARRMGMKVLPPDVNESDKDFSITSQGIRFGLGAVKGIGEAAIDAIIESRKEYGHFSSLEEFCNNADMKRINRRTIEALVACGAFDSTEMDRDILLHNIKRAVDAGVRQQLDREQGQFSLFGDSSDEDSEAVGMSYETPQERASRRHILRMEKDSLGFYISGHPLQGHEDEIRALGGWNTADIEDRGVDGKEVLVGGITVDMKERRSRNGDRMATGQLEDLQGRIELVVFPKTFALVEGCLGDDLPVVVRGRVRIDEGEGARTARITADSITPLGTFREERAKSITIELGNGSLEGLNAEEIRGKLSSVIENHPGSVPVYVSLRVPDAGRIVVELGEQFKARPSDEFLADLREIVTIPAVVSAAAGPAV